MQRYYLVIAEVPVVNYQHIFCCFVNHIIHHIQFPMSVWAYLGKYYQLINHIVIIKCFGYSKNTLLIALAAEMFAKCLIVHQRCIRTVSSYYPAAFPPFYSILIKLIPGTA